MRAAEHRAWLTDWADDLEHAEGERYALEVLTRHVPESLRAAYVPTSLWA
ncbi:hypothetical protein ACWCXC_15510 [Streptomyces sp. NPDC001515]